MIKAKKEKKINSSFKFFLTQKYNKFRAILDVVILPVFHILPAR